MASLVKADAIEAWRDQRALILCSSSPTIKGISITQIGALEVAILHYAVLAAGRTTDMDAVLPLQSFKYPQLWMRFNKSVLVKKEKVGYA